MDNGMIAIRELDTTAPGPDGAPGGGGLVRWRDVLITCDDTEALDRPPRPGLWKPYPCAARPVGGSGSGTSNGSDKGGGGSDSVVGGGGNAGGNGGEGAEELRRVSASLLSAAKGPVFLSLISNISLASGFGYWDVPTLGEAGRLVLRGSPGAATTLDLAGREDAWVWEPPPSTANPTFAYLYDLTLVNLPYSSHPDSLSGLMALAALSFAVRPQSGGALSLAGPRLRLTRCTLVLPDEEVAYLKGRAEAAGAATVFNLALADARGTLNLSMQVVLLNCTLLSASAYAALPGAVPLLPQLRVWPPLLLHGNRTRALAQGPSGLAVAPGLEAALAGQEHVCGQAPGGAAVTFVGRRHDDTVSPAGQDLEGGITVSGEEAARPGAGLGSPSSPAAGDVCTVSGYAPELTAGRTFTNLKGVAGRFGLAAPLRLRNLVLYNLALGGSGPPLEGGDAAWANSSLPLWYFSLPRSAPPGDPTPLLLLDNVTLVVPEPEWRALAAAVLMRHAPQTLAAAQRAPRSPLQRAYAPPSPDLGQPVAAALARTAAAAWAAVAAPSLTAATLTAAIAAPAAAPLSLDSGSGVLVLASVRHYGWYGTHVTVTYALPPDAPPRASLLPYPELRLPYQELADANTAIDVDFTPATTLANRSAMAQALMRQIEATAGGQPQPSAPDAGGRGGSLLPPRVPPDGSAGGAVAAVTLAAGTEPQCNQAFLQDVSVYFSELQERLGRSEWMQMGAAECFPPAGPRSLQSVIQALQAELGCGSSDLQVSSVLGRGAFGVVYTGRWRSLPVAVKTMVVTDVEAGAEGRKQQQAVLEAAISLSMAHENVVATYTYLLKPLVQQPPSAVDGAADGGGSHDRSAGPNEITVADGGADAYKLYIVQELCNGGSLRQALAYGVAGSVRSGGSGRLLALRLALDVARGVAHVHACRIVHGDLKPDNVLLVVGDATAPCPGPASLHTISALASTRDPALPALTAKVADFGLSLPLSEDATHQSKRYQGTPARVAPEVALHGRLSQGSDVWSYGIMLIEFFYGCTFEEIAATLAAMLAGSGPAKMEYRTLCTLMLQASSVQCAVQFWHGLLHQLTYASID
ncbi:hypothetical protein GPECTOR_38g330 [Gonium pectorale]|uniref:Protein kinase domain-containing protein n=1 Tax=Gonium pectorale TaxID=33097 RepID=A0A150GBD3_GONPE|nr:hypothetical protein GPECTOR_38g330 [Gonium pectorale]|eukprot:KXZ47093.1 hypothetical protein GPECTOR_38g330 [Gonium pectorale]